MPRFSRLARPHTRTRAIRGAAACAALLTALPALSQPATQPAVDSTVLQPANTFLDGLASDAPDVGGAQASPYDDFLDYVNQRDTMEPGEAGQRWAQLVIGRFALNQGHHGDDGPDLRQIVSVIPSPDAWPTIQENLLAAPQGAKLVDRLQFELAVMLSARLMHDPETIASRFERVVALLDENPDNASYVRGQLLELSKHVGQSQADPTDPPKMSIEDRLAELRHEIDDSYYIPTYEVEDLVKTHGEAEARDFLEQALELKVLLNPPASSATRRLAQDLVLANPDRVGAPQWALIDDRYTLPMFEAAKAKVESQRPRRARGGLLQNLIMGGPSLIEDDEMELDWEGDEALAAANTLYLTELLRHNRPEDASAFLTEGLPGQRFREAQQQPLDRLVLIERAREVDDLELIQSLLLDALDQDLSLPYWGLAAMISLETGDRSRLDAMIVSDRWESGLDHLSFEQRQEVVGHRVELLLGLGQTDTAIEELRKLAGQPGTPNQGETVDHAITLLRLANLLERPDLEAFAVTRLMETYSAENGSWRIDTYIDALLEAERFAEAQTLVSLSLRSVLQEDEGYSFYYSSSQQSEFLALMMRIYRQAGQPEQSIAILKQSPDWGVSDLVGLLSDGQFRYSSSKRAVLEAAMAMRDIGDHETAGQLAEVLLIENLGQDDAYEVLVDSRGPAALPVLEMLATLDRFEERPLIWKAELLHRQGQSEEALVTIQAAIAVDPSDGEQGRGNRMRAYAVLSRIALALGDQATAELTAGAVKAVRLSEDADRLMQAGLVAQALELYRESLTHFADAYCIQSRLAIHLAEQGRLDEAAVHYRRAYELMPSSFGRIESHCFGCEGAFSSETAQHIAEDVFLKMIDEDPKNPQLHYLLGYLRASQDRDDEAKTHYQQAVVLDPDYFNAWLNLLRLNTELDTELEDQGRRRLLELDPYLNHHTPQVSATSRLDSVWRLMEQGQSHKPALPKTLYALDASAQALADNPNPDRNLAEMRFTASMRSFDSTPSSLVSRDPIIQAVVQMFEGVSWID